MMPLKSSVTSEYYYPPPTSLDKGAAGIAKAGAEAHALALMDFFTYARGEEIFTNSISLKAVFTTGP
jgi:hypothetical protein